ncbi:hypothetical protein GCM10011297_11890 [Bacterioplanes sanyensis]|uniref:hypothetical protein n=1 Tax=Bacterioplanes sanyensis TaxID=1249553 RepID=UPI00167513ED|nr:hypothetical protein [Bacterioplanes sanyensis]GGY40601.1 hypothetical protein GCM10011297_11890 [Bacterioplanes sanyensis]
MNTTAVVNKALEANRRYTDLQDARASLEQAQRDLTARVISEDEYQTIADVCLKIIRASRD